MFHKILVAMDGSEISKHVFDEALPLAKAIRVSLMLLHVLSGEEEGGPNMPMLSSMGSYAAVRGGNWEIDQKQWEALENQGLELLRSHMARANTVGVYTEFRQIAGSPGSTICEVARTCGVDLIVTGRRGHSGLGEIILGSVSNYVLHHAPCSVLIVQHLR